MAVIPKLIYTESSCLFNFDKITHTSMNLAQKIINFNLELDYNGPSLPPGIRVMNPFREDPQTMYIVEAFYAKYYNDNNPRHLILGINPGRFGGGLTGIPFTDPKRLKSECGIDYRGKITHEPSSVFVYEVIKAYGGPERFYGDFYINSLCPLGFTYTDDTGREKNYNYYDSSELYEAVREYIVSNIGNQIGLGLNTETCFCFGTGKNENILRKLNTEHRFFKNIVSLEHPRFIMQYKNKEMKDYVAKYLERLGMSRV
jgi:hypothetical protein